jgi:hypothetical protein
MQLRRALGVGSAGLNTDIRYLANEIGVDPANCNVAGPTPIFTTHSELRNPQSAIRIPHSAIPNAIYRDKPEAVLKALRDMISTPRK